MALGGKREGAGRKVARHTLEASAAKARMVALVSARIDDLFAELMRQALPIDGGKGDIIAIKELLDRAYGKPTQAVTGEDGKNIKITHTIIVEQATKALDEME